MFPLCDVQVTELMIYIFCERNTHAQRKMKIIYIEVFGLIFFSEYLNDCFHFEGNARETCQLTVVWFPQEFPVTTQKLHEFKSKWTKDYSLSHLSLVKFKQEYSIMLRNSQRRSVRPPAIAEQQNLWGKS